MRFVSAIVPPFLKIVIFMNEQKEWGFLVNAEDIYPAIWVLQCLA